MNQPGFNGIIRGFWTLHSLEISTLFEEITSAGGLQDVVNDPKHSAALATHKALDLMGGPGRRGRLVEDGDLGRKWGEWMKISGCFLPKNVDVCNLSVQPKSWILAIKSGMNQVFLFLANWWDWRIHQLDTDGGMQSQKKSFPKTGRCRQPKWGFYFIIINH